MSRWPHAPAHEVFAPGAYIITAGTLQKLPIFNGVERLDLLQNALLESLELLGCNRHGGCSSCGGFRGWTRTSSDR
ncbi:MAG: hypothetical protein M3R13_05300 [Armatimonadota bacterium]|nr:hypothetical protein [Armatimonadota bacterium]